LNPTVNILPINQILHGNCKIVFTLVLIVLASCKPFSSTSNSYISKQQAISAALEVASTSGPEISGPHEEPSNISVQQMTLDEAVKKIGEHNQPATGYEPNMIVWFVTMEGLWLGEMSAPGVVPTPEPVLYHQYAIIIDAKTGLEIESSLSP
jgi:hypothetical protein